MSGVSMTSSSWGSGTAIIKVMRVCPQFAVTYASTETPVTIPSLKSVRIVSASCGSQHTALLSDTGEIYTYGLGVFGQLGHGIVKDERRPRLIESLSPNHGGERMVQVMCDSWGIYL